MKHVLAKLNLLPSSGNSVARQVAREFGKVREGAWNALDRWLAPRRRRWWDERREAALTFHPAAVAGRDRFAVFLIHQPGGILGSTLAALDRLRANGFAPLVVSNAPVAAADLARIAPLALGVLERPNLGHDFGGYRDGVLWLQRNYLRAAEVLLLNDSIWFPAVPETRALDRVLDRDGDVVGLFGNAGPDGVARFLDSFFLLVRAPLWASARFCAFWQDMPLYTGKRNVVEQCENGLSRVLVDEARGARAVHDWAEMRAHLQQLRAGSPGDVLDRLLVVGANRRFRLAALRAEYESGGIGSDRVWAALDDEVGRARPFEAFAYIGLRDLDYGVVKKKYTRGKPFGAAFLAMGEADGLRFAPHFEAELRSSLPVTEQEDWPAVAARPSSPSSR